MATKVASLYAELTLNDGQFHTALSNAKGGLDTFGLRVKSAGDSLVRLGTKMTIAGGAITGALGFAVKDAIAFEDQFANVVKTVQGTDEELQALRDQIREMATDRSNPLSSLERAHEMISKIVSAGGQLGVPVKNLGEFAQNVGELAVATELDPEQLALIIGQMLNVNSLEPGKVKNLASAIAELGNNAAAKEKPIMDIGLRIGTAGKNAGFHVTEVLAFATALAETGINAEAAGTNFGKLITSLDTKVAEGKEDLQTLADVAGLTAQEFKETWEKDAAGALVAFLEGFNTLPADMKAKVVDDLKLGGEEMKRVLDNLSTDTKNVTELIDLTGKAWINAGAAAEEAGKKADTTGGAVRNLGNKARDFRIEVGEALTPAIKDLSDNALGPMLDALTDFVEKHPEVVQAAAAIGIGITALGLAVTGLGLFANTILVPAIAAIGTALTFLTGPIGLGILAGAALKRAWDTNFLGIKDRADEFVEGFKRNLAIWETDIQRFINDPMEGFRNAWDKFDDFLRGLFLGWADLILGLEHAIGSVGRAIMGVSGPDVNEIEAMARQHVETYGYRTEYNTPGLPRHSANPPAQSPNTLGGLGETLMDYFQNRASGGPVSAGSPYIVGEVGPELFVPSRNGMIIPNGAGGMQIGTLNVYANDVEQLYDQLQMVQRRRAG